jgi:hypothetical protein
VIALRTALVPGIRLQAVERQDDLVLPSQLPAQMGGVGELDGHNFVVAVEQVGHAALGDGDPASVQDRVDLWHRAVLAVAQGTHQRHDVEAELLLRQGERALGFRTIGLVKERAALGRAAADLQPQPNRAGQQHERAPLLIAYPHRPAAARAKLADRLRRSLSSSDEWTPPDGIDVPGWWC